MNEQRYKKVGKRYVPVAVYEAYEGWAPGTYLLTVSKIPGGRGYITCEVSKMAPGMRPLLAAAQALQSKLENIIYQADKLRPPIPITPAQRRAWAALEKAGINTIYQQSAAARAKEILAAIIEAADASRKATVVYAGQT